jgi:predicted small secreted protein
MRWVLLISMGAMLASCDGTINGIGQDMQKMGSSLSNQSPEPPPPPPYTPSYRDDRYSPYQEQAPVARPYHDPSQPYDLRPR